MLLTRTKIRNAEVAELADALDSKSSVVTLRAGSSPAFGIREHKPSRVSRGLMFFRLVYFDSLFDSFHNYDLMIFGDFIYSFFAFSSASTTPSRILAELRVYRFSVIPRMHARDELELF